MGMIPLEPYKNRENVIAEIKRCASMARVSTICAFLFIALGVIGDALDTKLVLQPTIWLLLAISMGIMSIVTHMHVVAAKHFLGIEAESKKQ
jgi:hypothetical protein